MIVLLLLDLPEPTFGIRDIDGQWYYDNATICHPNGATVNRVSCSVRGEYGSGLALNLHHNLLN